MQDARVFPRFPTQCDVLPTESDKCHQNQALIVVFCSIVIFDRYADSDSKGMFATANVPGALVPGSLGAPPRIHQEDMVGGLQIKAFSCQNCMDLRLTRGWLSPAVSLPPALREISKTLRLGSVWNDTMMLFLTALHGSMV